LCRCCAWPGAIRGRCGVGGSRLGGMLAWCWRGDGGVESAADAGDSGGHLGTASADLFQHFGLAGWERHLQGGARRLLDAIEDRVDEPGGGAGRDVSGLDPEHGVDQVGMGLHDRLGQEATVILNDDVLTVRHGSPCGGARQRKGGDGAVARGTGQTVI
jgi:hypothetical protein